jgi:hypothetical protein
MKVNLSISTANSSIITVGRKINYDPKLKGLNLATAVLDKNYKKCESVSAAFVLSLEQSILDAKIEGSDPTTTCTF